MRTACCCHVPDFCRKHDWTPTWAGDASSPPPCSRKPWTGWSVRSVRKPHYPHRSDKIFWKASASASAMYATTRTSANASTVSKPHSVARTPPRCLHDRTSRPRRSPLPTHLVSSFFGAGPPPRSRRSSTIVFPRPPKPGCTAGTDRGAPFDISLTLFPASRDLRGRLRFFWEHLWKWTTAALARTAAVGARPRRNQGNQQVLQPRR